MEVCRRSTDCFPQILCGDVCVWAIYGANVAEILQSSQL